MGAGSSSLAWHDCPSNQDGAWARRRRGARAAYNPAMDLAAFDGRPFAARRERLAELLGPLPALVAAGTPRARNYAGNTFPFRAASHFLYLFGLPVAGALGFWDGAS